MVAHRVDRPTTPRRDARSPASGRTPIRVGLIAISGIVALTAIGGGLALILGLEQANYGAELLETTPFTSYLWPGLILAIVVGGSAAAATIASIRHPALGGLIAVVAGAVLIGWIVGEMLLLEQPSEPTVVEVLYLLAGLAMILLGALAWRTSRSKDCPTARADGGSR
jgi:hypothetical protein